MVIYLPILLALSLVRAKGFESRIVSVQSFLQSPPSSVLSSAAYDEVGELVILFGGANSRFSSIYSSFYFFNISDETWNEVTPESSLKPPKVYSAFSFSIKNKFYILFGMTETQISLDFYSFDLKSEKWSLEVLKGQKIDPVIESAEVLFEFEGKNYFAIHGGVTSSGQYSSLCL